MNVAGIDIDLKRWKSAIDWKLLLLLLLFLNVKLTVKIPAIVVIYLLQFNFKFGFRFKNSRLPLFYLLIIGITFLGMLINRGFKNPGYNLVFLTGVMFWGLCLLAIHQVKLSVDRQSPAIIHRTIVSFFIINAIVSAFNLLPIIWETKAINPYLYQGEYQKYFISTGDYIKGLTFDTSTTNAVINAMGILYFFTKKNYILLLVCMATLLLTGSNFINISVLLILMLLFIFRSSRDQKSIIVICFMMLLVFMSKISPQNTQYVSETLKNAFKINTPHHPTPTTATLPIAQQPDSLLSPTEIKEKIATLYLDSLSMVQSLINRKNRPETHEVSQLQLPQADINSAPYQHTNTPLPPEQPIPQFINTHKYQLPYSAGTIPVPALPGKVIGWVQTVHFMAQHPAKIIIGNGIGNFSSKLAFRATGLGIAGGFPHRDIYINPDFMLNHLDLYLNFFSRQSGYHSLTNSPFSVYDQLLSEYGILGLLFFIVYYLGFFWKHHKRLTYGLPVLLLMMIVFFIDYWFEQLSVLVLFELLLLLNIKETAIEKGGLYE